MLKQLLKWGAIAFFIILAGIQFFPIDRTNPPVSREVRWDSPETRLLAQRACFDCHSNETIWPWYSRIAPVSLILYNHITEGRSHLNFSAWDQPNHDFEEVEEVLSEGKMPSWDYLLMHPEARLTEEENNLLLSGLRATYQQDPPVER